MQYEIELEGRKASVSVRLDRDGYRISIDGGPERLIAAERIGAAEWLLTEDGTTRSIGLFVKGEQADLQIEGHALRGTVVDSRRAALAQAGSAAEGIIKTPMPGVVSRILFSVGQPVTAGQVVLVIEAMKMENEYKSKIDGVLTQILVAPGQPVDANTVLAVVEAS